MAEWQEEILKGMQLLQKGCCHQNKDPNATCDECPLDEMCDCFCTETGTPKNWWWVLSEFSENT